jgi:hypothetical protein
LRALKDRQPVAVIDSDGSFNSYLRSTIRLNLKVPETSAVLSIKIPETSAVLSINDALKKLREATDDKTRREAADALDLAVQRLRQELGQGKKDAGK